MRHIMSDKANMNDVALSKLHNIAAVVGFMIDKDLKTDLSAVWSMLNNLIGEIISN